MKTPVVTPCCSAVARQQEMCRCRTRRVTGGCCRRLSRRPKRVPPAAGGRTELQGSLGSPSTARREAAPAPARGFAGLSSTIRGHSHPTMRERTGERRRSKAGPYLIQQQQQQPLQSFTRNSPYTETATYRCTIISEATPNGNVNTMPMSRWLKELLSG